MAQASRKIKLLLYSINFAPELTGIGKYNGEMVRWLSQHGYEVRVVTAPPYYPQWKVQEGYSPGRYARHEWNGASIWRCPIWVPTSGSGIKRLLHLLSFALSSAPVMLRQMLWRPDICLVVEPPIALSPVVVCLSKIFRMKSWLHVQDFEVDAAFELGLLPNRLGMKTLFNKLEGWLMRSFDLVSSISEQMTARLRKKGVRPEQVRLFPNWVDGSEIYPLSETQRQQGRMRLGCREEEFIIQYSGNMGAKQGLEMVLDMAERLRPLERIVFLLCGDGVAKKELMEQAARRRLSNVRFLPLQPADRLNELLNAADVHLLMQKGKASDLVMPSKLTGMLASGKAVVAVAEEFTAVHEVIQHSRAGIAVPPGDLKGLVGALQLLAEHDDQRKLYGERAREYAMACLSYQSVMSSLHRTIGEIGIRTVRGSGAGAGGVDGEQFGSIGSVRAGGVFEGQERGSRAAVVVRAGDAVPLLPATDVSVEEQLAKTVRR